MAYASKFNPDALPAHAEPEEAAQILSRRHNDSNTSTPAQTTVTPPLKTNSPTPSDYSSKPQPPLPLQTHRPNGSSAGYHRNALATPGGRSPLQQQRPYSPGAGNRIQGGGPPPPASLQTGPYQRRPSTPVGGDGSLWPLFLAVDVNKTGHLSENELSQGLKNGDYSAFDPATVRMMIRMHDSDNSGTIGFVEFCALWKFLGDWRGLFDRFDEDQSGTISFAEFSKALEQFGYNLTPGFVTMLYRMHDKRGNQTMSFDLFVQSCLTLKRLTDIFKKWDTDRDGYITLGFEDFLTEVLNAR